MAVFAMSVSCSNKNEDRRPQTEFFEPTQYEEVEGPEAAREHHPSEGSEREEASQSEPRHFWGLEDRAKFVSDGSGRGSYSPPLVSLTGNEKLIHVTAPVKSEDNPRRRVRLAWLTDMSRTKHLEVKFSDAPEHNRTFDVTSVEGYTRRYHEVWGPESSLTFHFALEAFTLIAGEESELYRSLDGHVPFEIRWFEPDTDCRFSFRTTLRYVEEDLNKSFGIPKDQVEDWGDRCAE